MSKIKEEEFKQYDELFYEFIKFLHISNKFKDLKNSDDIKKLTNNTMKYLFLNEVTITNIEEDEDFTIFDISKYLNKPYSYYVNYLIQYEKSLSIVTCDFYFASGVYLIFSDEYFGVFIRELNNKETIENDYILSYKDLNNFQKLWNKILQLIKETIENE
jgi:hypothetical protein